MQSKPLIESKSFWAIAGLTGAGLAAVDWQQVLDFLGTLLQGAFPQFAFVIEAALAFIIAVLGAFGVIAVKRRETKIEGIVDKPSAKRGRPTAVL